MTLDIACTGYLLILLLVSVFPRFTISFGIAVSDIHCFRDTGHFYPCVCVFGYLLLSAGCVTYLQDIYFARLLSCGDVERKTEVLTVSSLHLSIDEVRTGVFRGTVTLSLSFRAKTISGPSLYSQLSQLLLHSVILFSTFAEYSAYPPSLPLIFPSFLCCIYFPNGTTPIFSIGI